MDFYSIQAKNAKRGLELYPDWRVKRSNDLLIKGGSFYAFWDEDSEMWNTNIYDAVARIDKDIFDYRNSTTNPEEYKYYPMQSYNSGHWNSFNNYIRSMEDTDGELDSSITFLSQKVSRKDMSSKRVSYDLVEADYSGWDKLISTLYSEEERRKIEWAIGSILAGDSKKIQKFIVLYGAPGAGKSTILNIIQKLFDGYYSIFDAAALVSTNNAFASAQFQSNPLVAIQQDGDLSKIETNAVLNSIVAHEEIVVNEKFKAAYTMRPKCFIFMATNKPVKITDAQSGLLRRLITVVPSGNRLGANEYNSCIDKIDFELGAIANHCLEVYRSMGIHYYDDYRPIEMQYMTDRFFNFVEEQYFRFKDQDHTTLQEAYDLYKQYCADANLTFIMEKQIFREELKHYFNSYIPDGSLNNERARHIYKGFKTELFEHSAPVVEKEEPSWLSFDSEFSRFDTEMAGCPAQLAKDDGLPSVAWDNCRTVLSDIDTTQLHYIRVPLNHVILDFDIKNERGEKDFLLNLKAASKFPPTYAELSKSGAGIHLHYIYEGDPLELDCKYDENIEVKVYVGKSSLRRKLSRCNELPFATLRTGQLPIKKKKEKPTVLNLNETEACNILRNKIKQTLRGEANVPSHKCGVDWIAKCLQDAYDSGLHYDMTDMRKAVLKYAAESTNQSAYCIKMVDEMKWMSEDPQASVDNSDKSIIMFDIEVFPNLLLVCYKLYGEGNPVLDMVNPTPEEVGKLINSGRLVGFNNLRYDNIILYTRYMGGSILDCYDMSQRLINGSRNTGSYEAKNVSWTDIYDFCAKKQSLKKWEIELGLPHEECKYRWDEPLDESKWPEVTHYCHNDVLATEAVFNANRPDWLARQILADVSGLSVNDTTNSHTKRIIFGDDKTPQNQFNYWNLAEPVKTVRTDVHNYLMDRTVISNVKECRGFMPPEREETDAPVEYAFSALPYFPGYTFDNGKSLYRGEEVGEGGYVYAEPGIYHDVALLDIASMHPTSLECMCMFGPQYTNRFSDIKQARIYIKHKDYDAAASLFDGKLAPYLKDKDSAKALSYALKIAINSVYGLTSAKFDNQCRDPRNIDNIVAKRGALFMIDLKHEIQKRGFTVAHIKTDSIKIPNATPEIIEFVMDFGRQYGYIFEHEATYDKICLVNDAVYIAHDKDGWHATGTQFQVPYVYKTLFTGEEIEFADLCETKSASTALYLDFNEGQEDAHAYQFVGKCGSFCPMKPGAGGGLLMREKDGKYNAATGTKGYRWMESSMVERLKLEDYIDRSYYDALCRDAIETINKYGSYDAFAAPF